jgi:type I restriction enzyme M protein
MLDNITKKNIDDCRDVLVGKVPDPKSQIEQITLALIYKFMDDMDKEAVEKFKGKAKFFTGEYAKYGWRKLFDPSLSGQDMLALYSEALEKLNTNPNIPELFRNIFKNAYLPYRDPSTLKLFLKYINEFEYSHSEKLGDAFEYLLSVMGSQGDAGQFRTPRHIIDFVTACINPQKNETVLDPACGTAGFLLSAYKHIINQNTDKRQGDKLKPDDRKKLATNFVGYDISPDMVRLSLANMYLHGFATPLIHEYDSLSSEDRWQETFDVILANPPFMTPKGGIRPHKKFGVQANKAEVLFTDYIAEHLNPNGRAGIVVPNGIVATSQTAYKQLRKMLVQDSLIAVISLPAGVFQPYSGVKTSVLILDKCLAKKSQHILFLKIENDGFDLGAQRREIDKNDLPLALQTLEDYKQSLSNDKAFEDLPSFATLVKKEAILGNKDVVLSSERYFVNEIKLTEYEVVTLGEVCNIFNGSTPLRSNDEYWNNGNIPWFTVDDIREQGRRIKYTRQLVTEKALANTNIKLLPIKTVLLCCTASVGEFAFTEIPLTCNQQFNGLVINDEFKDILLPEFLFILSSTFKSELIRLSGQTTFNFIAVGTLKQLEIPLPPLEIQQQIVAEIESYQKIIDGAKQIVNNYKPTISINPDWEMMELGAVELDIIDGDRGVNYPKKEDFSEEGYCLFLSTKNVRENGFLFDELSFITKEKDSLLRSGKLKRYDVVMTTRGTLGNCAYYDEKVPYENIRVNSGMILFRVKNLDLINSKYVFYLLQSSLFAQQVKRLKSGAAQPQLPIRDLMLFIIPVPTIEEQKAIVKAIEEEMQLVNANKRLIEIFEQKIKLKIGEVWGVKEEVETLLMVAEPQTEYNK